MAQVIWVNKLINGKVDQTGDEFDKPFILKFSKNLDKICRKSKITEISTFIDSAELQAEMMDDFQGFEDGYSLVESVGKWFEPEKGIEVIEFLITQLKQTPIKLGLISDKYNEVIEELV